MTRYSRCCSLLPRDAVLPWLLLAVTSRGNPAVAPSCHVTRYSRGGSCHVTDARDLAVLPSMPDCCHATFNCCCILSQGFLKKEEAIFRFETERVLPSLPDCCHPTFNRCCILSLEVSKKKTERFSDLKQNEWPRALVRNQHSRGLISARRTQHKYSSKDLSRLRQLLSK